MKAYLIRAQKEEKQTLGSLQLYNGIEPFFECKTLELPWKNNAPFVSCIPTGTYKVKKHNSPKFGRSFHVLDVPRRSEILIHRGNYNRDTLGCILPGLAIADIDGDGLRDVTNSSITIEHLWDMLPDDFELTITE